MAHDFLPDDLAGWLDLVRAAIHLGIVVTHSVVARRAKRKGSQSPDSTGQSESQ